MQYDPNRPIWLQVMNRIKTDIVTGRRAPGEKLPGGRDMAVEFSINPNTAARVYKERESEALVETLREKSKACCTVPGASVAVGMCEYDPAADGSVLNVF